MIKKIIKKILKTVYIYFHIIFGSILIAIALNLFLVPNKIAAGGVSGIAIIIYYISNEKISVGVVMLVLNIPLFIAGIRFKGINFIFRTMFATVFLSISIDISYKFMNNIYKDYFLSEDYLLYSIFGGAIMGIGIGVVFRAGATTGGTDMAAMLLNLLFKRLSVGQILMIIDACVIISAAIAFQDMKLVLYAIISLFITIKAIDFVVEGVNFSKAVFIISDNWKEIGEKVLSELDKGVTVLVGKGMYTGNDKMVLLCITYRGQVYFLKELVQNVDNKSFIFVSDVREVFGEGFKNYEQI